MLMFRNLEFHGRKAPVTYLENNTLVLQAILDMLSLNT